MCIRDSSGKPAARKAHFFRRRLSGHAFLAAVCIGYQRFCAAWAAACCKEMCIRDSNADQHHCNAAHNKLVSAYHNRLFIFGIFFHQYGGKAGVYKRQRLPRIFFQRRADEFFRAAAVVRIRHVNLVVLVDRRTFRAARACGQRVVSQTGETGITRSPFIPARCV